MPEKISLPVLVVHMASSLFTVDGVAYDVYVPVGGLKRSFKVLDGPNAGRLLNAQMTRDVLGTFYNYKLEVRRKSTNLTGYDRLYEVLSSPEDSHIVTFPYGQETLTFRAYVTGGDDQLVRKTKSGQYWDGLSIEFVAMEPYRRP